MNLKITVEPVLFLFMLSTFMLLPALQDLIYTKVCLKSNTGIVCDNLYAPANKHALNSVQSGASYWILASNWMLTLPAMIAAPFLGSWSDLYGRKIPMIFPSLGGVFSSFVYIAASVYIMECPMEVLLLASFISGILGSYSSCILTCMSYMSQISTPTTRTWRLSILESMTFIAASVGPFISAGLQSWLGRAAVFTVMMAIHSLTVFYILFGVKDIFSRPTVEQLSFWKLFSCKRSQEAFLTITRYRQEKRRTFILILLAVAGITMVASACERDVTFLFLKDDPIKWDVTKYSTYLSLKNCIGAIALILLKLFSSLSDGIVLCVGLISKIGGLTLLGLASSSVLIYLSAFVGCLNTWCVLAIRASISKLVEIDEQGKAFAFFAVLESFSGLVGAGIFNTLYPVTRTFFSGFTFLLAAMFLGLAFVASCYAYISMKKLKLYDEILEIHNDVEDEIPSQESSIDNDESIS